MSDLNQAPFEINDPLAESSSDPVAEVMYLEQSSAVDLAIPRCRWMLECWTSRFPFDVQGETASEIHSTGVGSIGTQTKTVAPSCSYISNCMINHVIAILCSD
jgi:hypothetical protein